MLSKPQGLIDVGEQSTEVDGINVRYSRAGNGSPLVLVHGLLGYSFSWRYAIPIFAQNRAVYALDMPGSGFSDALPALDARLSAAAHRLSRFLDTLGIRHCDLIGSSYGGATALRLATSEPHRIKTLVLVSPANPWSMIGRKRLAVLGIPGVRLIFPHISRRLRFMHGYFVRRMYGDPARVSADTLHGYSLPLVRPGVLEHAVRIARSWQVDMRELKANIRNAADIPTLVIWGSKDRLVDLESAQAICQNFRNARTVIIEGAGHLPYEEVPEQFCPPVLDFLETYSPAQVIDGK